MCWMPLRVDGNNAIWWCQGFTRMSGQGPIQSLTMALKCCSQKAWSRTGSVVHRPTWPKPVTLDGYVLANLTARWQLTSAVSLVGRIENLLDEQYHSYSGVEQLTRGAYLSGRRYMASLRFAF